MKKIVLSLIMVLLLLGISTGCKNSNIEDKEVKINKEIRDYTESVYFGLSLRQFIFSILACGMAVVLYFVFRPYFGIETLSWLCILGAAPFAAIGFIKYNGMNAEEFLLAYIRSEFLTPKELVFNPTNYYYEILKGRIGDEKKDENNKKSIQTG